MRRAHGDVMAVQSKTILRGGLHLAVMANVIGSNPVRDVSPIQSTTRPKGASALTGDELRGLLVKAAGVRGVPTSRSDRSVDLVHRHRRAHIRVARMVLDRFRRARWDAGHHRQGSKGGREGPASDRRHEDGRRPPSAAAADIRDNSPDCAPQHPYLGEQPMIFPSTAGTWRDPDNFRARWREVREELGVPDVTSHSFRKSVATLIDDEGFSARIGADHLRQGDDDHHRPEDQ
jgi:integrase